MSIKEVLLACSHLHFFRSCLGVPFMPHGRVKYSLWQRLGGLQVYTLYSLVLYGSLPAPGPRDLRHSPMRLPSVNC